jgi:hypothetical protein
METFYALIKENFIFLNNTYHQEGDGGVFQYNFVCYVMTCLHLVVSYLWIYHTNCLC